MSIIRHTDVLANETNKANGTYYYSIECSDKHAIGFDIVISGSVTVTIEGTMKVEPETGNFRDITSLIHTAATLTTTGFVIDYLNKLTCFKEIRIKVVCAGGGTDDYRIDMSSRREI